MPLFITCWVIYGRRSKKYSGRPRRGTSWRSYSTTRTGATRATILCKYMVTWNLLNLITWRECGPAALRYFIGQMPVTKPSQSSLPSLQRLLMKIFLVLSSSTLVAPPTTPSGNSIRYWSTKKVWLTYASWFQFLWSTENYFLFICQHYVRKDNWCLILTTWNIWHIITAIRAGRS